MFCCHSKPGGEGARDCYLAGKLNNVRKEISVGIAFSLYISLYSRSMEDLMKHALLNIFKCLSLMLDIYPSQLTSISIANTFQYMGGSNPFIFKYDYHCSYI